LPPSRERASQSNPRPSRHGGLVNNRPSSGNQNKHADRVMSGRRPSRKEGESSRTNVALRANLMNNG